MLAVKTVSSHTYLKVKVKAVINVNGLGVGKARVLEAVHVQKISTLLGEHSGSTAGVLLASLHQESIVILHAQPNKRIRHCKFL